ncbi:uncharacterized protein LAESUDRAFT_727113 [Laetiporus sulphureus 93-53]|uniref:Uncharacterized protein n=1 Tax=Laetiporus sulphureus 93-53 TaxID=1314785 RepID=A0A165DRE0_9APHY|nr:uncharacterized protein LAESUDRAFT_727113 [Laetiporus sulphureus 93-53]KZT05467.1 hypothetical protein LAESUDRAFT_727113 [Laetiporus sulphureus 93-53]
MALTQAVAQRLMCAFFSIIFSFVQFCWYFAQQYFYLLYTLYRVGSVVGETRWLFAEGTRRFLPGVPRQRKTRRGRITASDPSDVEKMRMKVLSLALELDKAKSQAEQEKQRAEQAEGQAEISKAEVEGAKRELEDAKQELERSKDEANRRAQELEQTIESLKQELAQARRREETYLQERDATQALLETRRLELQAAHTYFTAADSTCETDVVRTLRTLNAEIFQAVKAMANSFSSDYSTQPDDHAVSQARTVVGQAMTEILLTFQDHHEDTIMLEMALQSTITLVIRGIVAEWDLSHWQTNGFSDVYSQMVQSESQSVAGRWRALTRKYLPQKSRGGRDWIATFSNGLAAFASCILIVAGGNGHISDQIADCISTIVRTALTLRTMIGEDIIGSDYFLTVGEAGQTFDKATMEDGFATRGKTPKTGARVLCPSELGLRRVERDGKIAKEVTLVKAKVVVDTFLEELQFEALPPPITKKEEQEPEYDFRNLARSV